MLTTTVAPFSLSHAENCSCDRTPSHEPPPTFLFNAPKLIYTEYKLSQVSTSVTLKNPFDPTDYSAPESLNILKIF